MTTNCTNREPSDAEMNDALEALARWQTPGEFASKVKAFDSLVKSSTLFNKANAGFLLDAIPIAAFATHRAVQSVRLVRQRERLNDGQFRNTDETIDIEVTEIMDPGRRRGDEYRCGADQQSVRHFDPHLGEAIAKELAQGRPRPENVSDINGNERQCPPLCHFAPRGLSVQKFIFNF